MGDGGTDEGLQCSSFSLDENALRPCTGSSGWALKRRNYCRVQSGGPLGQATTHIRLRHNSTLLVGESQSENSEPQKGGKSPDPALFLWFGQKLVHPARNTLLRAGFPVRSLPNLPRCAFLQHTLLLKAPAHAPLLVKRPIAQTPAQQPSCSDSRVEHLPAEVSKPLLALWSKVPTHQSPTLTAEELGNSVS